MSSKNADVSVSESRARARVEDLLAEAEEVRGKAMEYVRTYADREGNIHESEQPDFRCALAATELKAKLLGYLGDGRNLSVDQLRHELDKLGWKLEPKGKPKVVGK